MLCRHPCIEHAPRPASGSQSPRETLEHPTIAGAPVYPALFLNLPGGGAECRIYLMALLYFTKVSTCSTIADAFDSASHDCLTRMLHGDWSGQTLFDLALRLLFVVAGGT